MKRFAVSFCLLLLTATTAGAGMKVTSKSWDRATLAGYGTYSWQAADDKASGALVAKGTKLASKLEQVGDAILSKAGLEKSANGEPDFVLRYRGLAADLLEIEGTTMDINDHVKWVGDPDAHSMTSYKKGALLVEALDAETEELLWAGWAVAVVELIPDRKKLAKKAEKAMTKILKEFPAR